MIAGLEGKWRAHIGRAHIGMAHMDDGMIWERKGIPQAT